jgi:glutamate---cysteine ligase / carboxylate-amine ligase
VIAHQFNGPPFTVGVEEELMILDAETFDLAQGIEQILEGVPSDLPGEVKPELMQSVLEVATLPCADLAEAEGQLRRLRDEVQRVAGSRGMCVGASGTHPSARWEDQLIVERPRYQELAEELGFVARQELIFGTHVHVAVDGPNKAVYVADGIRQYLPLMLALSSNSPLWRGTVTGMMSSRTPVFRAFPRVGIPPYYGSWEIYSRRVELMMKSGAIPDYTYLWWDVRPHPNLGTVEVRVFDQQTRLEHTLALAALVLALVHRLSHLCDAREPMVEHPSELIDDNKVRAALHGLEGELIDFHEAKQVPAARLAGNLVDELREHAEQLGCVEHLEGIQDLCRNGTGARRQIDVLEGGGDVKGMIRELVDLTATRY